MLSISENTQKLISQFGQNVTIVNTNENALETNAFIQPLRSDYQSPLYGDYSDAVGTEQYLYIGLPSVDLSSNRDEVLIKAGSKTYEIKKVEQVYFSEEVIYERAVLEEST